MKTELTDNEIRARIAEAYGLQPWMECGRHGEVADERIVMSRKGNKYCPWCGDDLRQRELPDYLHSLDAMAQAEATLTDKQHQRFRQFLWQETKGNSRARGRQYVSAPPRARALAFLATIAP